MMRSLAAGVLALAAAMPAAAADLPYGSTPYRAPAYAPAYNWTGFYVGLNAGGAFGSSDWAGLGVSISPSGAMFGVTAGYNWQIYNSPWVLGLEADIDWTGIDDSALCPAGTTCETSNDWFGTVRGRAGYSWGRIMPYVTGGIAFGNIDANRTTFAGASDGNIGWTIGVGIEGAIVGNWTAKAEYLYADLGDTSCSAAACGTATNVDLGLNILRAGVNYRF